MADAPVLDVTPEDGVVRYDEGIHIGYRAWLRSGAAPAYPFRHGLGYTKWTLEDAATEGFDDDRAQVRVRVANTGDLAGQSVVQVYAEKRDSAVDRPERWLWASASSVRKPGRPSRRPSWCRIALWLTAAPSKPHYRETREPPGFE